MTEQEIELLSIKHPTGAVHVPPNLREVALGDMREEKVTTVLGDIVVHTSGDRRRPVILTFHDIGQNAQTCFQGFFQFSEMATLAEKFFLIHVNAPGQELEATHLPENYVYPSMSDLADMLNTVLEHFSVKSFIRFGVGAGGNVLCRFALKHPIQVNALILVNCSVSQAGWVEWAYQKMNVNYLWRRGMTTFTVDYLMWHHFGKNWQSLDMDLVKEYYQHFCRLPNPKNLAAFIESYISRTELEISREGETLKCPVLQLVGQGPHVEDTVQTNAKLNPATSNWMKLSDCGGMVLDEAPEKVTEAIMLFLQGEGYLGSLNYCKWVEEKSKRQPPSRQTSAVLSLLSERGDSALIV